MENKEALETLKHQLACEKEEDCINDYCEHCPNNVSDADFIEALTLAISALEKQEADREAIPHRNYQYLSDYWCECGWHLGKKGDVKFCSDCGKRIKWD